jgi:hypothetical protein
MKKKKIILPKLRYENAPETDSQISIGFESDKSLLRGDDRDVVLNLSEQFTEERANCKRYKLYGKMRMVFRNLYAGATSYDYLRERLSLVSDGSDNNFCGYLPYNEFAFLRDDIYYETTESLSVTSLSGFTGFTMVTSGPTEHQTITSVTAPYHNWNLYTSYISGQVDNFPMKYTLSGRTKIEGENVITFTSGDGIPFRVEETEIHYVLTSPVRHGISRGEYILIDGRYYYVNSVGDNIFDSEYYVINILKSQLSGVTFNPLVIGKRCIDIKDTENSTSKYYVHKHTILTSLGDCIIDKVGFESPIWEDEKKVLYENSVGDNDVLVVRNRMEAVLFDSLEPFILTGITNNLGYTPLDLYTTIIFRNGNGYFEYPPKVGYSFHMHDSWMDDHFSGSTAIETGLTSTSFTREGFAYPFYSGNSLSEGSELYGAFVEYNPKELKERIISESFHKIVSNKNVFNHGQDLDEVYSGATETNQIGLLYQPHYRFKLKELSPYIEIADDTTPIYNLPENAVYFPNEKIWRWRDIYEDGYIDPDGYGTDYPYLNDIHFIHKDINFYLRNEKIYKNKKDGIIDFHRRKNTEDCVDGSTTILRGAVVVPDPSISVSPSITASVTPTITLTVTPTITPTISLSPSEGSSPSPTPSITPTISSTPSITPSITPTITMSRTMTPTPSISITQTPSISLFVTPSTTTSITPSISLSATPGLSPSITPSITSTISITPTITSTISTTPSISRTPDISSTPSISVSVSRTPSISFSRTPSMTPTISFSKTPTPTLTMTPSITVISYPVSGYFISPTGSDTTGTGTIDNPWFTLNKAWEVAAPGVTIYMRGGLYQYNSAQLLSSKSGTVGNRINVFAYPGEKPTFTKSSTFTYPGWPATLVRTSGSYQHWKGLEISGATQTPTNNLGGFTGYLAHNSIFEQFDCHHNGGGFQLLSAGDNLVLNSDFHHNWDPYDIAHPGVDPYGDADGCGIQDDGYGTETIVRGCRFWNNSDDGIDLWYSRQKVTLENCWSWNNGYREDGVTEGGDGNGFKLGPLVPSPYTGYSTEHRRTIQNCIAFDNRTAGFTENAALCVMKLYNNISYRNGTYGFAMMNWGNGTNEVMNNIAYANVSGIGAFRSTDILSNNTFLYNNVNNPAYSVSDADFVSVVATGVDSPRQSDGSLPILSFLRLADSSDLIWSGIAISGLTSDCNGVPYHDPPSLGSYEWVPAPSSTPSITPSISRTPSVSFSRTPSITPSISLSRTPSITLSRSLSVTPTISLSRTPSRTPSVSIGTPSTLILADHTVAKLSTLESIPSEYISAAKSNLHIVYEHTSHGSQIIDGMTGLVSWKGSTYAWNNGGTGGALDIHDHGITGWSDLGNPSWTDWEVQTRTYLNNPLNSDVNVIMWSWCGEVSDALESNIDTYLALMSQLEADYPSKRFVYMTGHLDGTGVSGNLHLRNQQIRNYCISNNKVLFDFADIESYDPDDNYYLNLAANDNCDYTGGNWAIEWQTGHTLNVDWYDCITAHSQPLNGNKKTYAAWYMFARLAGWDGTPAPTPTPSPTPTQFILSNRYVSNSGSDSNNGLSPSSPWQTINKVNTEFASLPAGTGILFKRGDTFDGTITVLKSGNSGSPMTLGAYDSGADPIINGFTTITGGWTDEGGGIYSHAITSDAQTNMVLVDGVQVAMGRWPNTGYRTFESHSGSVSITDTTLSEESPYNWTGAEVVIRMTYWLIGRFPITNHSGDVITYGNNTIDYLYDNFGYFIQNDIRCLDTENEWYHDQSNGRFYIYGDPTGKVVQIATKNYAIRNHNGYDYITVENLSMRGTISDVVAFNDGLYTAVNNCVIQNCVVEYGGECGMNLWGSNGTVHYNTIRNCNGTAVRSGSYTTVRRNTIQNIGLIPGQTYSLNSEGIRAGGYGELYEYNRIENIGYNGIGCGSITGGIIRYNYISNYCRTVNDGGGIYHGHNKTSNSDFIIRYNLCLNGYGNTEGTSSPTTYLAEGIYLDSWATGQTVQYNVCANNRGVGIKVGSGNSNILENNLCFNNEESQIYFLGSWLYASVFNNMIRNNHFIAKTASQIALKVSLTAFDNIANYGDSDLNYYARPINQGSNDSTILTNGTSRTLSGWRTYSSQDASSNMSLAGPVASESNIHFIYNDTDVNQNYSLSVTMYDVENNSYSGTIILKPYTGLVLFGSGTVTLVQSPLVSLSPSVTPSISFSKTPSITPSITLSVSRSRTPLVTPTISLSRTPTITPSITSGLTFLTYSGQSYYYTTTGSSISLSVPKSVPTVFKFLDNSLRSVNLYGYMIEAGAEVPSVNDHHLDGELICGNKFTWDGNFSGITDGYGVCTAMTITHGLFTGHMTDVDICHNYLWRVPMGIIRKSGNNMTNSSGGVYYNILRTFNVGGVVKGMSDVVWYNNTFYQDRTTYSSNIGAGTWRGAIDVYTNTDIVPNSMAYNTKIKNNIFYSVYKTLAINVMDNDSLTGFECDYNLYWCEAGDHTPVFRIAGTNYTWSQWTGMGYDQHSIVVNPNFNNTTDLVPGSKSIIQFGTNLGTTFNTGLSTSATWVVGTSPQKQVQSGTWQVGARIFAP